MRVDEFELFYRARHVEHLRLIEHGEGMMRERRRRQQHGGQADKAESFPGHNPLHELRGAKNTTNAGRQESPPRVLTT